MNFLGKKVCGVESVIFVAYLVNELAAGCHVAAATDFFFFYEGA